jgi:hypothetical protein
MLDGLQKNGVDRKHEVIYIGNALFAAIQARHQAAAAKGTGSVMGAKVICQKRTPIPPGVFFSRRLNAFGAHIRQLIGGNFKLKMGLSYRRFNFFNPLTISFGFQFFNYFVSFQRG